MTKREYLVPVYWREEVSCTGSIFVKAESPEDAIRLAAKGEGERCENKEYPEGTTAGPFYDANSWGIEYAIGTVDFELDDETAKRLWKENGGELEDETPSTPAVLPPDPEGMNDDRATWARIALHAFMKATGTDFCDAQADLLCNLMHLSDRSVDINFEADLARARTHYEAETDAGE